MPQVRKPTVMLDVARLAQVSTQTVSRVINDHPHVRAETRVRVQAAVRALRYRPNIAARTLVTNRSRMIGVVAFGATSVESIALLYAIEGAANPAGYQVSFTGCTGPDGPSLRAALSRLGEQDVEGIILMSPVVAVWTALDDVHPAVPTVIAGADDSRDLTTVAVHNRLGAQSATRHLLDLGHHTVHHIGGREHHPEMAERRLGWQAALGVAGRPAPAPQTGDGSARSGYAAGRGLAADPAVTAIFCATDQMAVGALRALEEAGRAVPDQVSVVGFGDVPEAAYLHPPLTTVRQDVTVIGHDSVVLLLAQISGRIREPVRRRYPPCLIVRASTAAPTPLSLG